MTRLIIHVHAKHNWLVWSRVRHWHRTDFDVTFRQSAVSDRNLACTALIHHNTTLSNGEAKVCLLPWQLSVKVCLLPWQLSVLSHCHMTDRLRLHRVSFSHQIQDTVLRWSQSQSTPIAAVHLVPLLYDYAWEWSEACMSAEAMSCVDTDNLVSKETLSIFRSQLKTHLFPISYSYWFRLSRTCFE